jgi:hypothetical protein
MEFHASIRPTKDTDLGEEHLARKIAGRALVGDDEDRRAGLFSAPKQWPKPAGLDVGRGKCLGKETDSDAQNR